MTLQLTLRTESESDTEQLGRRLAQLLQAGDVVFLVGPLGAGKTVLARGLIRERVGADIDVPSPTFALIQHYEANIPITHADLYRLEDASEAIELGLDEAADAGILIVEWPEHGEGYLPTGALTVKAGGSDQARSWTVQGDKAWAERIAKKDWTE